MNEYVNCRWYKRYQPRIRFFTAFLLMLLPSFWAYSQQLERKIIIENGKGYYITIDPEFQVATLFSVDMDKPIKTRKDYVLPAGRNFNLPVIPFSWDTDGNDILLINFMNNALTNRRNALKCLPLHSLQEWNETTSISDVVIQSAEIPSYTSLQPYEYIRDKSSILENFFFDVIETPDSAICFAAAYNGELTVWTYANHSWQKGEDVKTTMSQFFSLFNFKKQTYLITNDGIIYLIKNNKLVEEPVKRINKSLSDGILIIDKMNDHLYYMDQAVFDEKKSLIEIIKNKSTPVFL
ncbi:MAG TPA: hypothetical protein VLB84_05820 [Bacteroidia bacterium]|nr:hypothetical protein [Bacteroidia bacterium]